MMLMTKFGKFKIRLIATINMSVLLSIFNIASTTSNWWAKYFDKETNESHLAGLWRSCSTTGIRCSWKNGIMESTHTSWSAIVRLLLTLSTITNFLVIIILIMAFFYKLNKKSRSVIKLMELANCVLIGSFICTLIGFSVFISANWNISMWLHITSMIIIIITSNMITRTFAALYFQNTRLTQYSKSVETGVSNSKLTAGDAEEKIALKEDSNSLNANTNSVGTTTIITAIEMNKISEANGSNEALIPAASSAANANNQIITISEVNTINQDAANA